MNPKHIPNIVGGYVIDEPPPPKKASDMTLRDWFAGMAMQGLIASMREDETPIFSGVAATSYQIADAMIMEAENEKSGAK